MLRVRRLASLPAVQMVNTIAATSSFALLLLPPSLTIICVPLLRYRLEVALRAATASYKCLFVYAPAVIWAPPLAAFATDQADCGEVRVHSLSLSLFFIHGGRLFIPTWLQVLLHSSSPGVCKFSRSVK